MNQQGSLDELVPELVRRGLPVDYAERSVAELVDHHADLSERLRNDGIDDEQVSALATARLGDPRTLLDHIVIGYRRRTFAGRWPTMTFVVAPPLVLFVAWYFMCIGLGLSLRMVGIENGAQIQNPVVKICVAYLWVSTIYLAPVLAAVAFTRLARRVGRVRTWALAACFGMGLLAGLPEWSIYEQRFHYDIPPARFLSFSQFVTWYSLNPWQSLQFLLPVAVCLAMTVYQERRGQPMNSYS